MSSQGGDLLFYMEFYKWSVLFLSWIQYPDYNGGSYTLYCWLDCNCNLNYVTNLLYLVLCSSSSVISFYKPIGHLLKKNPSPAFNHSIMHDIIIDYHVQNQVPGF